MDTPGKIWSKCGRLKLDETAHCDKPSCRLIDVSLGSTKRVGDIIDNKVTLLGVVGRGGMATVYRAFQHSVERNIAIKILHPQTDEDPNQVRSFLKEATSASRLNHPHIITVYDVGQTAEGELYLMMELLDGQPLSAILRDEGPLLPQRSAALICQICDALHQAHQTGVIHRDLKPSNIFVRPGAGRYGEFAKVLDFGVAKLQEVDVDRTMTQAGMVCGTPAYMSPEQAMSGAIDSRSDLYALAIIFYQMLTGTRPFEGPTPMDMVMAHLNTPPPDIRDAAPAGQPVPEALARLIMQSLAKDPAGRPDSVATLKRAVLSWLDNTKTVPNKKSAIQDDTTILLHPDSGNAYDSTLLHAPPDAPTSKRGWIVAVALLVAAGVGLAWWGWDPTPATPTSDDAEVTANEETENTATKEPVVAADDNTGETQDTSESTTESRQREVRDGQTAPNRQVRRDTAAAPPPQKVRIQLRSNTPAKVYGDGGALLGPTPLELVLPPSRATMDLRLEPLESARFKPRKVTIRADGGAVQTIQLKSKRGIRRKPNLWR